MRFLNHLTYIKQFFHHAASYIKGSPLLSRVVVATFLIGFLFFIFAWVPYKQTERNLTFLKKDITETKNGIQELNGLLSLLTGNPRSLNDAGITYRFRSNTEASLRATKIIGDIPAAINKERGGIANSVSFLLFYPGFSKKIKNSLDVEIYPDEQKLKELTTILEAQKSINQALLNLIVFDPDTFFSGLLSSNNKRVPQKLYNLNESIGKTESSLSNLDSSVDKRLETVLEFVKYQHEKIIAVIDGVASGNITKAETSKNQLASQLSTIQLSLGSWNSDLLQNDIDKEYLDFISDLLLKHGNLINNIDEIQDKYF